LSHRRLQTWPSTLTKSDALLAAPLPAWLHEPIVSPRLDALGCFAGSPHQAPNHVLINEYRPGQGIMPHEDGSAYYPLVATVSLGAPIVLDLYKKNAACDGGVYDDDEKAGRKPTFRILQEPRSLLITTHELYTQYLHGIAERLTDEDLGFDSIANWEMLGDTQPYRTSSYDRKTRVSLTYRDVLKVAKVGNSVKFLTTGR
jgi:alkylated DNA repair protein alkB family protein 6